VGSLEKRPWLIALLITAWSIICHGYRYGVVNHGMQLPLMRMVAGETCFDHDDFMQAVVHTYTTVFFEGVGLLARVIPLEPLCFALFILFRFGSVALCMRLGRALFSDIWAGAMTAVLVSSQTLTFAEDMVSDTYLNHDALAQCLILGALILVVEKRTVLAFLVSGFIAPIQSLHAAHLVPLLGAAHLGRAPLRTLVVSALAACVGFVPILLWMRSAGVMGAQYPPGWVDFARAWFPTHYFPSAWSLYDWLLVATPIAIAVPCWKLAGTDSARGWFGDDAGSLKRLFVLAIVFGLGLGLVCEVAPIPFLIRLHPMRASWIAWLSLVPFLGRSVAVLIRSSSTFDKTVGLVAALACILSVFGRTTHFLVLAPVLWSCAYDKRQLRVAVLATVALALAVPFAIVQSHSLDIAGMQFWVGAIKIDGTLSLLAAGSVALAFLWREIPPKLVVASSIATIVVVTLGHVAINVAGERRGNSHDFVEVEHWLAEHRAPGEVVLVPLGHIGVRAFSCQTPALDFEDGLASYHDPAYIPILEKKLRAYGWQPGEAVHGFSFMNHLAALDASLTADDLRRIGGELGARIAVRDKGEDAGLPVVFQNDNFTVVDLGTQ
jgi:hypothetical protein